MSTYTNLQRIQFEINYLKRRINCLCDAITALEQGGGGDGNGIYGGSGNVPNATTATLDGSFSFLGTGVAHQFDIEVGDGVSETTYLTSTPGSLEMGYVGSIDAVITYDSSGVSIENLDTALLQSPGDLLVSGLTAQFNANENQGFGDAVFINGTNEAQLGDASVSGTTYCIGMCTGTVTTGNTGTYLLHGFARNDAWNWTPGRPIFLSLTGTTTNTLTQTKPSASGEVVQLLAFAVTADVLYWNPQLVQVEIA